MEHPLHSIDCRWLLALYAVIPLSVLLVTLDLLLWNGWLANEVLPGDPNDWPLWAVLFGLPHIIASLLTMANGEYLSHYRRTLLPPFCVFLLIAIAGHFGPQPVSYNLLFVFLAFYTIYHVLAQQLGLTLMMLGTRPDRLFTCWKWLAILAGFAIYINVYGMRFLGHWELAGVNGYELMTAIGSGLCAAVVVLSWRLTRRAKPGIGRWYLWANAAMLVSALLINELGYTLFVILIPRIIHDLTAYSVYITHDRNRNRSGSSSLSYRLTHTSSWSPFIVLPLSSLLIAYALTSHQNHLWVNIVILTLSFLHYYYEGFIWRGPNPHRQYIAFKR